MSIKKEVKKNKLSFEILGIFGATAVISIFFFGFLSITADSIVISYCDKNDIILTEMMEWTINSWIKNISFAAAVILFVILFLFLLGQKISYLKEIILGIEALRTHRMNYQIPISGNNEFTELAESINFLSQTEMELKKKEEQIYQEKETLIKSLSHDIRTPLTSILSYSEYMSQKESLSKEETKEYISLMQRKAGQIKTLTDQLLDGSSRTLEHFENAKFLFEQLAGEWESSLENSFPCLLDFTDCPSFSGEFDVSELQRIFDNLSSNIEKYADSSGTVILKIYRAEDQLIIEQKNKCKADTKNTESNKIGIENIQHIAARYNGNIETSLTENEFFIKIILRNII